ncbi:MAG: shikimate kinase [Nitrospirae bacterium]|nr:MAG: shikimate kinase [Nitrospirota bacterium]
MVRADDNIVLIGMPGAGKSTCGLLLAKVTGRPFIDTDVWIQTLEGRRLQEIIDQEGLAAMRAIEERRVLELQVSGHVVATGGSVVYSEAAMDHLRRGGVVVFLEVGLEALRARLGDAAERGIVRRPDQSFADLYAERLPLYRRYADHTVVCDGLDHEGVVARLLAVLDGG